MRWRNIGPFRAGRTKAAAGVASQPYTFYIGVCNGGVWKTTDAGRTWKPIFDDQPTGSIGWVIAVAPSDPNIVYVGSGEGLPRPDLSTGDGIYKSTDAGKTVDASRAARRPADSEDRRRSEERESPVRRRARPSVRTERGARHLPLDRRRPDVPEGALQGREHRRQGRRHRSRRTRTSSTRRCGKRGRARGKTARGAARTAASSSPPTAARHGSRSRRDCPTAIVDAEIAIAPSNPRRATWPQAAERDGRGEAVPWAPIYRSDDAGETWTKITTDARGRRSASTSRVPDRRSEGPGHDHRHRRRQLQVHRRRQDVGAVQGRAGRRRLPEHLDQPERPEHHAARRAIRAPS